jgi:succinyl-diaminopimelate desuccinylase
VSLTVDAPVVEAGAAGALAQLLVAAGRDEASWDTRDAADFLEERLSGAFELKRHEPTPGHRSVVATHDFGHPGPTLILCGHLDVVPAGAADEWTVPPFGGTVRDGRLFGRGACDMKGAVASLAVAALTVVEAAPPLRGRLVLAFVADEEVGGRLGAGALVAAGEASADGVIIAEPSEGSVCISHRGICFVAVVTRGRSGHASMPERAENAVDVMVDVLAHLRSLRFSYDSAATTMTPGAALGTTINGGTKANVIPDYCRAVLDVRKVPGMTDESVVNDIRKHLASREVDLSRVDISVENSGEPAECDPAAKIVEVACAAYEQQFGSRPPLAQFPAASDGFWFASHAGAPTLMAFGPGSLQGCHVVDESIALDDLDAWAQIYSGCILRFLSPID